MEVRKTFTYIANDGETFATKDACIKYERTMNEITCAKYAMVPIEEKYELVKTEYDRVCENRRLDNDYLIENGCSIRDGVEGNIAGDYQYGIVYLRDDAVDVLIEYIDNLKKKISDS